MPAFGPCAWAVAEFLHYATRGRPGSQNAIEAYAMRKCPYCGEEVQEDAKVCRWCHSDLTVPAPPAPVPLKPKTSGKAIASLVLGIFPVIPLVGNILAIVFGHLSRGEIRRSAGRLKGGGLALAGLILGYTCVVAVIATILLIIMGHLALKRVLPILIADNQASAVRSLRTINRGEVGYASTFNKGYSPTLAALPSAEGDGLIDDIVAGGTKIDSVLAGGTKSGYVFTYEAGKPDANGHINTYTVRADPSAAGTTGVNHYFTDQTGIVRVEQDKPADSSSPPIGE